MGQRQRIATAAASLCAGVSLLALAPAQAQQMPSGGQVVAGTARIGSSGSTTTVTQTSRNAVIDWSGFSIGKGGSVTFANGSGATLNRVAGLDPSVIAGRISATGSVYLINPAGVVISSSGHVVVGGDFVASTLAVDPAQFMAGQIGAFSGNGGTVSNAGTIESRGGNVALIGGSVNNSGSLLAPAGVVAMVAGDDVLLDPGAGNGHLLVAAASGGGDVTSSGRIVAAAAELVAARGNVYALAGNGGGVIEAAGSATGGGRIWLTAGDTAEVGGTLDADKGGTIAVTGQTVSLTSSAVLSANGTSGGTILVGGDRAGGANPAQDFSPIALADAMTTSVAAGASLSASGSTGNGGHVVIWSNAATGFAGTIAAGSQAVGAKGGFAEVSSHGVLSYTGSVDLTGRAATPGNLLLDPENLSVIASGTTTAGSTTTGYAASSDNSVITVADLENALASGNVILSTGSSGSQAGDITVQASFGWSGASNLTLNAYRNVTVAGGTAITNSGSGNLILQADATATGTGTVTIGGKIDMSQSTGHLEIFYNPASFAAPTDYSGAVTVNSAVAHQLTAYMLINSFAELSDIGQNLSGNYALARSVDGGGATFAPLGTFTGIFNGLGNTISNLAITDAGAQDLGLFRDIGSAGTITNLALTGITVTPTGTSTIGGVPSGGVGTLAGENFGTISQVSVTGAITMSDTTGRGIGGLAGYNEGTITRSTTDVTISSVQGGYFGGISGGNSGTISLTGANGAITTQNPSNTGGLVGSNFGTITQDYATGAITTPGNSNAGGLVSVNYATIDQSYATGAVIGGSSSVSGSSYYYGKTGGLAAWNYFGTITNSFATGAVTGGGATGGGVEVTGGLLGENDGTVKLSYAIGKVTAGSGAFAGAAIGRNSSSATQIYFDSASSGMTTGIGSGTASGATNISGSANTLASYAGFSTAIWGTSAASTHPYLLWAGIPGGSPGGGTTQSSAPTQSPLINNP